VAGFAYAHFRVATNNQARVPELSAIYLITFIRMDVKSFSKSDAHSFEDRCLAHNLFE
jgi:hypothetical protein